MAEREGQEYIDAGQLVDYKTNDPEDENTYYVGVVKCYGCGAIINGGGQSRAKHDAFHNALANLFDSK